MIELYEMKDHLQMSVTNKDRSFTCSAKKKKRSFTCLCLSRLILYSRRFVSYLLNCGCGKL